MDTPPTGNRRGRETRHALLEAAWKVIDELSFAEILGLVSARSIAERAGRTEGAFRHHFDDSDEFAHALVELDRPHGVLGDPFDYGGVRAVVEALESFEPHEIADVVYAAAAADWEANRTDEETSSFRGEMLLFSRLATDPWLANALRDRMFNAYLPIFAATYRATMDRVGADPLDDLTIDEYAMVLAAMTNGFMFHALADPDGVDERLVAAATTAVALSLATQPDQGRRTVRDIQAAFVPFAANDIPLDDDRRREVAIAARPCFARGTAGIAWSTISAMVDVDEVVLRRSFERPERLAAWSFAAHVASVGEAAAANAERDPRRPLVDACCELVRRVRTDRHVAAALLAARIGDDRAVMAAAVPLGKAFPQPAASVTIDVEQLIDVVITLALGKSSNAPAAVAENSLRAVGIDVSSGDR